MSNRADKLCERCGRTMQWRTKWAKNWEQIKFCSDQCRRSRLTSTDAALESAIITLLDGRSRESSICPSEAARLVGGESWESLMESVRMAARRLVAKERVQITQGGRVVDPSRAKGPIRIRRFRR